LLLLVATLLATGGPLGLRTQGPLRELFLDITGADARPIDRPEIDLRYSIANTWNEPMALQRGSDWANQELDEQADSLSLRVKAPWPFAPWIWTAVEWKLTEHWGGWSDGPIEGWHSIIGAFNYQRTLYPRNELHLVYEDAGARVFNIQSPTLAPGDLTVRTQAALPPLGPVELATRFDFKLPVGNLSAAGGSGGFDAGVGIVATWPFASWGALHGLLAVSAVSHLSAPAALQPRALHLTGEASFEATLGSWTLLLEDRCLSPLMQAGWEYLPTGVGGDDALLSSGDYADFRAHNQVSLGVRRGPFSLWMSEDFTPGPNPKSVLKWVWVSNAPDVVLGVAFTQPL
jgi:hypothetical protein